MRELFITPRARLDLLEIWNYIAQESLPAANRVGDKLDAEIRSLLEMPGKGHSRPYVKDTRLRFWRVYSYFIAYRYDDGQLTIVRIVHGHRNFRKVFRR